jgi:transposase
MAGIRKTYTEDFKNTIAELAAAGKAVKEICSEYSLNETVVRRWIKDRKPHNIDGDDITIEEMRKMKRENAKLREEVEILKKAMAIFATK